MAGRRSSGGEFLEAQRSTCVGSGPNGKGEQSPWDSDWSMQTECFVYGLVKSHRRAACILRTRSPSRVLPPLDHCTQVLRLHAPAAARAGHACCVLIHALCTCSAPEPPTVLITGLIPHPSFSTPSFHQHVRHSAAAPWWHRRACVHAGPDACPLHCTGNPSEPHMRCSAAHAPFISPAPGRSTWQYGSAAASAAPPQPRSNVLSVHDSHR